MSRLMSYRRHFWFPRITNGRWVFFLRGRICGHVSSESRLSKTHSWNSGECQDFDPVVRSGLPDLGFISSRQRAARLRWDPSREDPHVDLPPPHHLIRTLYRRTPILIDPIWSITGRKTDRRDQKISTKTASEKKYRTETEISWKWELLQSFRPVRRRQRSLKRNLITSHLEDD